MAIYEGPQIPSTSGGFAKGIGKALEGLATAKAHKAHQKHQMATQWEQTQKELQYKQGLEQQQKQFLHGLEQQKISTQSKNLAKSLGIDEGLAHVLVANPKLAPTLIEQLGLQPSIGGQEGQAAAQNAPMENPLIANQQQQQGPSFEDQWSAQGPQQNALQQALSKNTLNPQEALKPQAKQPLTKAGLQKQINARKLQEPWQILDTKPRTKQEKELFSDARKEQHHINAELKPDIQKTEEAGKKSREEKAKFERIDKILDSGKLTAPGWAKFYNTIENQGKAILGGLGSAVGSVGGLIVGAGIPGVGAYAGAHTGATLGEGIGKSIGGLIPENFGLSEIDQIFNKDIMTEMGRMKEYYGGNVAVQEMDNFIKTLPTLQMDNAAKRVIVDQIKAIHEYAYDRLKAMREIKSEHNGYYPSNLMELIDEKTDDKLQKIRQNLSMTIDKVLAANGKLEEQKDTSFAAVAKRLKQNT